MGQDTTMSNGNGWSRFKGHPRGMLFVRASAMAVLLSLLTGICAIADEPADRRTGAALTADELVNRIIEDCRKHGFNDYELVRGREDILPLLLQRMESESERAKQLLLTDTLMIASPPDPKQTRWVFSQPVARFLVDVLLVEKNLDRRDDAAKLLIEHFPENYISPLANDILKAAAQPRHLSDRILLLGKTGSAEARQLLLQNEQYHRADSEGTNAALARLGDTERSLQFVKKFEETKNPQEKARLAARLGYIGDASCVMALARAMRCPMIYESGVARIAVRVEIVKALSEVYPESPALWYDYQNKPRDDSWYERAENWLTRHLQVKWKESRPDFFYSEIRPDPMRD